MTVKKAFIYFLFPEKLDKLNNYMLSFKTDKKDFNENTKMVYVENLELTTEHFTEFLKYLYSIGTYRAEIICKDKDGLFDRYLFRDRKWSLDIVDTLMRTVKERKEISI